jgi:hypothetical protein
LFFSPHLDRFVYNGKRRRDPMKRTNIYLEETQHRRLKRLASQQRCSVTALIRQALDEFLAHDRVSRSGRRTSVRAKPASSTIEWNRRLEQLLARVRQRTSAFSPDEIEADITAARHAVRRRRTDAARVG